jgi:hypothetical protein
VRSRKPQAGGRKVDIAKYESRYQSIIPVGAVTRICYLPEKGKQQNKRERKEPSFEMVLDAHMKESPMDENQSFQVYC